MLNDDELYQSFDNLRNTARSLEDMRVWFTQHPYSLLGDITPPPNSSVEVSLSIHEPDRGRQTPLDNILSHVTQHGKLPLVVNISILQTDPKKLWERIENFKAGERLIVLSAAEYLNLALNEWPLATALVTAKFVRHNVFKNITGWNYGRKLELLLDESITHHFPNMTMSKIRDLAANDLLITDTDGRVTSNELVTTLFRSREKLYNSEIPSDLSI